MSRLQKKCFIASSGIHLMLLMILLVGPAFLSSSSEPDNLPLLNFVPVKTVDALTSGGGTPGGQQPAPVVPATPPQPPTPAVQTPPSPPQPVPPRVPETSPARPDPAPARTHKIVVSTTPIVRRPDASTDTRTTAQNRAQEQARQQAAAAAVAQAVNGIQSSMSGSTKIELNGPGGGGVPYANWKQAVKTVYDGAWILPAGVSADSATATASVTIARDGRVISSRIVRFSGNPDVDQSVQAALDRVRYAAPLPDDAKEDQRTITINFDVKAKLLG